MKSNTSNVSSAVLSERAVLIHVGIGTWSAKRTDEDAKALIASNYAVQDNKRIEAKKHLINPDHPEFKEVRNKAQQIRVWHYEHSVPWMDGGLRMIGALHLDKHAAKLRELHSDWQRSVDAFCASLPTALEEGRKALGGLAKDEDYPSPDQIRGKFKFAWDVLPVPDKRDIRVELSAEGMAAAEASVTRAAEHASHSIVNEATTRVARVLGKFVEKLGAKKKDDPKEFAIFRDSLVDNIGELAPIIDELNILNDPEVTKLAQDLRDSVAGVTPKAIRDSGDTREKVLKTANSILDKVTKGGYGRVAAAA